MTSINRLIRHQLHQSLIVILIISCLFHWGCEDTDVGTAIEAGADVLRAATLADDYGVLYLIENGYHKGPAISALTHLAVLDNDHSFLSSHPSPQARVQRLREDGYDPHAVTGRPLLDRLWGWLKRYWPFQRHG